MRGGDVQRLKVPGVNPGSSGCQNWKEAIWPGLITPECILCSSKWPLEYIMIFFSKVPTQSWYMWHQVQELTAETGSKGTGITLKSDPGR